MISAEAPVLFAKVGWRRACVNVWTPAQQVHGCMQGGSCSAYRDRMPLGCTINSPFAPACMQACEMFILELTLRAWNAAEENKRRTLQRSDVAQAITRTDIFDFLVRKQAL